MAPPTATASTQEDVREASEPTRRHVVAYGYVRCECRRCKSHLDALGMGDFVLGVCSNCDATDIAPLSD